MGSIDEAKARRDAARLAAIEVDLRSTRGTLVLRGPECSVVAAELYRLRTALAITEARNREGDRKTRLQRGWEEAAVGAQTKLAAAEARNRELKTALRELLLQAEYMRDVMVRQDMLCSGTQRTKATAETIADAQAALAGAKGRSVGMGKTCEICHNPACPVIPQLVGKKNLTEHPAAKPNAAMVERLAMLFAELAKERREKDAGSRLPLAWDSAGLAMYEVLATAALEFCGQEAVRLQGSVDVLVKRCAELTSESNRHMQAAEEFRAELTRAQTELDAIRRPRTTLGAHQT